MDVEPTSLRMEHRVMRDGRIVANGFEKRVVARMGENGRLEVTSMPGDLQAWLVEDE